MIKRDIEDARPVILNKDAPIDAKYGAGCDDSDSGQCQLCQESESACPSGYLPERPELKPEPTTIK